MLWHVQQFWGRHRANGGRLPLKCRHVAMNKPHQGIDSWVYSFATSPPRSCAQWMISGLSSGPSTACLVKNEVRNIPAMLFQGDRIESSKKLLLVLWLVAGMNSIP
jgi:hypothetical protein